MENKLNISLEMTWALRGFMLLGIFVGSYYFGMSEFSSFFVPIQIIMIGYNEWIIKTCLKKSKIKITNPRGMYFILILIQYLITILISPLVGLGTGLLLLLFYRGIKFK